MRNVGKLVAICALALAAAPQAASARHWRHATQGYHASSWDGRWAGAWGGNDPTAVIVRGGRVVAYEYGGATNPVGWSRVTPHRITYGESNIVVTLTRTGANTAHATIKTGQGNGTAELRRR